MAIKEAKETVFFGFHINVLCGSAFGETESSHASDYAIANRTYGSVAAVLDLCV